MKYDSHCTRRIIVWFAVIALLWSIGGIGEALVQGSHGRAPMLPPNVPGIERPFPQSDGKFTFAVIGDKTGGGERNWPIFDRAMDEVSHLRPDFAIMVGDLIQGYTTSVELMDTQWKEFLGHANDIQVPLFFLPGNHDISNKNMYDYWEANVGRTYYSFDYEDCHFIFLNTEEGWKKGEAAFGTEQLEWVKQDINGRRNTRHLFLFMHRPVWYSSGEPYKQWETIESWLEGLPFTVFAGHFHRLAYEKRRARPYYVLSATGAELTPNKVREYGSFHHYSIVTVDGSDVHVAVVEPGSVHPGSIAPREFREKAQQILTWDRQLPLVSGMNEGQFIAHLNNPFEKVLTVRLNIVMPEQASWRVSPMEVIYPLQSGERTDVIFKTGYTFDGIFPIPSCAYEVTYEGEPLLTGSVDLFLGDTVKMKPVEKWKVAGPFHLGLQDELEDALEPHIPAFAQTLKPEKEQPEEVQWQDARTYDQGWLDIKLHCEKDFSVAYGLTYIQSPKPQKVLASIAGVDFMKVLVNHKEILPYVGFMGESGQRTYFLLPLEAGWNTVLVKCASYTGQWGYMMQLADQTDELIVSARRIVHEEPAISEEEPATDERPSPPGEPRIIISHLPPSGAGPKTWGLISGQVTGVDPRKYRVVVYALGDRWYAQPIGLSHTPIQDDGTWKTGTHLGMRYAVLLVKPSYIPPGIILTLPEAGGDILAILVAEPEK